MRIVYKLEETEAAVSVVNENDFFSLMNLIAHLGALVVNLEELDLAVI
jgi:hypothetical protein